ncbi:unnamed protein product [Prorocentrum cordatum]|uniref:Anaphase-promoting complex subunit 5 n=1 Tax=Prorocentrum cordatum TaxID=2364126 RepID=A0ABN9XCH3_9DINO|nr:unnamed protein product [Polarella glacialis]
MPPEVLFLEGRGPRSPAGLQGDAAVHVATFALRKLEEGHGRDSERTAAGLHNLGIAYGLIGHADRERDLLEQSSDLAVFAQRGGRARQRLEDSVALAALGAWRPRGGALEGALEGAKLSRAPSREERLGDPGSDVEKKLSKAMRARHAELDQDVRKEVAGRVLGVAVFRGRLAHLLEREVGAGAGADAEAMLRLFLARGRCVGAPPSALAAPPPPGLGEKLAAAAAAWPSPDSSGTAKCRRPRCRWPRSGPCRRGWPSAGSANSARQRRSRWGRRPSGS